MKKKRLYKILMSLNVIDNINDNLNELLNLIPELKDMIGFEHNNPYHYLDVWNHTLSAIEYAPRDFELRVALLLHDIGKPHSYQDDGEVRHFKNHPKVSSEMAFNILTRLGFEEDEITKLCYLIKEHDNPITDQDIAEDKELAIFRFKIQFCDILAHSSLKQEERAKYLIDLKKKLQPEKVI